jgi:hypothetical protein
VASITQIALAFLAVSKVVSAIFPSYGEIIRLAEEILRDKPPATEKMCKIFIVSFARGGAAFEDSVAKAPRNMCSSLQVSLLEVVALPTAYGVDAQGMWSISGPG